MDTDKTTEKINASNHRAITYPVVLLCVAAIAPAGRADVDTRAVFDFSVRGEVAGSDLNSRLQFEDSGRISGLDLNLQGERFRGEAGDLAADWNELSFSGHNFRGLRFGTQLGRAEATLLGGAVNTTNLAGRSELSTVFGVRTAYPLSPSLRLNAAQLWSTNSSQEPVSAIGLEFNPTRRDRLALELARSSQGTGWQLGLNHQDRTLELQARYRQVSDGFSSAGNPKLETERSGYAAKLRYRPQRHLSVSATTKRFTNAWQEQDSADTAVVQLSKPGMPSVSLYWQQRDQRELPTSFFRELEDSLLDDRDDEVSLEDWTRIKSQSVGVQLSKSFGKSNVSLGLEKLQLARGEVTPESRRSQRLSFGYSHAFGQNTTLHIFHSRELAVESNRQGQDRGEFTQVNVSHRLNRRGLGLRLGLQHQKGFYSELTGKSLAGQIGISVPLTADTSVDLDWRSNLAGSGFMRSNTPDVLQLKFRKSFQVGNRKKAHVSPEQRRTLASITGYVFEDVNLNGRWDTGEPPIHDVTVRLNGNQQAVADSQGRYSFADLMPREYRVELVTKTVPIEYTVLTATQTALTPLAGKSATHDFPLARTGRISGIAFRDENQNGQHDAGDTPLSNLVVRAQGSEVIGITDEKGHFLLDSLPPGQWPVTAEPAITGYDLEVPVAVNTRVTPNSETGQVMLALAPHKQSVISSFKKVQE